jgi:hypothetical protein
MFDILLPKSFAKKHNKEIKSGKLHLCIPGGYLDRGVSSVVIPTGAELRLVESHTRELQQQTVRAGTKKLLAVRIVTTLGEAPAESLELIQGAIFGTGPQAVDNTVVSQYAAVSHGSLKYTATSGPGISNGVVEVTAALKIAGTTVTGSFISALLNATAAKLGPLDRIADHIMFCLPDGSVLQGSNTWTGFTFLYETVSLVSLLTNTSTRCLSFTSVSLYR